MIGLVLHPAILIGIIWTVARYDAEINFLKALLVVIGVGLCSALLGTLHPLLGLLGYIVILPAALMRFCYLRLKQALIVTGIFVAWLIAYELISEHILR
jgi:hypothetical protein